MDELLEPLDVLKEVKEAFDANLIDVSDTDCAESRAKVRKLRERINKAISDGRILERVYAHCSGACYEECR